MTDNRTPKQKQNQILPNFAYTDEHVEASAVAAINSHRSRAGLPTLATLDGVPNAGEWRDDARAALVAAQGAAPQAVKDVHEPSHDRVYCVRCGGNWPCQPAPVLPSSGVDEDALAEEIGRHKLVHVSVSRKSAFCACDPSVTAGVDDNRAWFEGHRARAVAAWLKDCAR